MNERKNIITVSELNFYTKELLESSFVNLWVKGEVSGITQSSLGHYYFTLKDQQAQTSCALFKYQAAKMSFKLKEGVAVQILGKVTLYVPRGSFQIVVQQIEPEGLGKLYEEYLHLKDKLEKAGYFAPEKKKTIPAFPKKIGVVTSSSGAALRDILTTLKRRMSQIKVIIYPAMVQGKGSEEQIANAIKQANSRNEVDVLIVARGGGSLEDLWSFNEEIVINAVYYSKIPIISGIGHETDTTLIDFVSDKRAATPTAAAELASPNQTELKDKLVELQDKLNRFYQHYNDANQRLDQLTNLLIHPSYLLERKKQELFHYKVWLQNSLYEKFSKQQLKLQQYNMLLDRHKPNVSEIGLNIQQFQNHLWRELSSILRVKKESLHNALSLIEAVSPKKIQERGYSIVRDHNGQVITSSKKLKNNQRLNIDFIDGEAKVIVYKQADLV